jgi:hypothetical protein
MSERAHHDEVPITIDRNPEKSPNPTTGAALYVLGKVKPDYDLFRETHGHGDDELIPNDSTTTVDLKPGDRFYTAQRTLNPGASSY